MHAAGSTTKLLAAPASVPFPTVPGAPGAPIAGGPNWSLWDETNAVPAIVAAIEGARSVVDAEYFQITGAGKGAAVTAALVRAAKRGVEVNVIADLASRVTPPLGSFDHFRSELLAAGGHVAVTTVVDLPWSGDDRNGRAFVDHRKVVTVDGRIGFVGGMNLARLSDAYHDSMLQLAGVDAARLGVEELDRWRRVGGSVSSLHHDTVYGALGSAPVVPTDPTAMRILVNAPEQAREELTDAYVEAIRGAKRRIWISSPGYSSQTLIEELKGAVRRGVDVRFIAAGAPPAGFPLINWVSQSNLAGLVRLGARATIIPEVLHRKALIVDDMALLSSFNITDRSRSHDHEIGVRTTDPAFVHTLEGVLQRDLDRGRPLDPATRKGFGAWLGDLIAQRLRISY